MANKALWDITPELLEQKIENYKHDIEGGVYKRASWPHLASYLDTTEEILATVIRKGSVETLASIKSTVVLTRGPAPPAAETATHHF